MEVPMSGRLVVFYSQTDTTRAVAKAIAETLGCAIERIVDLEYRAGVMGLLRSLVETTLKRGSRIANAVYCPAAFDLTVIGSPVWHDSMSSPVRSYLTLHRNEFHDVAFFSTGTAPGGDRIFKQMSEVCGKHPAAVLSLTADQVARHAHLPLVERFRNQLTPRMTSSLASASRTGS
jgi:flavodoxin